MIDVVSSMMQFFVVLLFFVECGNDRAILLCKLKLVYWDQDKDELAT